MKSKWLVWRGPCLFVCLMALAACSSLSKENTGVFRALNAEEARIVTSFEALSGGEATRVEFKNRTTYEEYALFRSAEGQAEVVFIEVPRNRQKNHSLDYNKLISDILPVWRFQQGRSLELGDSRSIKGNLEQTWMQPFRQADMDRDCVGFYSAWDENSVDPEIRPTRMLFGYHCNISGMPLTDEQADAFVTSLDIKGISVPLSPTSVYDQQSAQTIPTREQQIAQMVIAQDGIAGGTSGTPAFPFLVTVRFVVGDRCIRVNC